MAVSNSVLGMNARNYLYINKYNTRHGKWLADNKLATKEILAKHHLSTPKLIASFPDRKKVRSFDWTTLPQNGFVLKPTRGYAGAGIIVLNTWSDTQGQTLSGIPITAAELETHIFDIFDGAYSLQYAPDVAYIEEIIRPHSFFKKMQMPGLPDIRVIVFNNIPVMAMLRIPTQKGKGNLAQGALGLGIDIRTGVTQHAYSKYNTPGRYLPGTKIKTRGIKIPFWDEILLLATKAQSVSKLGFTGIDIVIDQQHGPMILELNARPGLDIQNVNKVSLRTRLERVENMKHVTTPERGIEIAKSLFSSSFSDKVTSAKPKPVIGLIEKITLNDQSTPITATIDIHSDQSEISQNTAEQNNLEIHTDDQNQQTAKLAFTLHGIKVNTTAIVTNETTRQSFKIGKNDLNKFLIDPHKMEVKKEKPKPKTIPSHYHDCDQLFEKFSRHVSIIKAVRPINVAEEKQKFFAANGDYNPQFEYRPLKANLDDYRQQTTKLLEKTNTYSPLGQLYTDRLQECLTTLDLISSVGKDPQNFTNHSIKLFGQPQPTTINHANHILQTTQPKPLHAEADYLNAEQIAQQFKTRITELGLPNQVTIEPHSETLSNKISIMKFSGQVKISDDCQREKDEIHSTIAHEIDVHATRSFNGSQQPFKILQFGTAGYIQTEEGLATIYSHRINKNVTIRREALALLYLSINYNLKKNFKNTYRQLKSKIFDPDRCFRFAVRTKRGIADTNQPGAFTKDLYLQWLSNTQKFLDQNPNNETQLIAFGKIHTTQLAMLKQIYVEYGLPLPKNEIV